MLQKEKDMAAITGALEREREEMAGTVPGTRELAIALANGVYPVSSCVA